MCRMGCSIPDEDEKIVEKCGVCGYRFRFNPEVDPIGMIQTGYLVPKSFVTCCFNVFSKTSQENPTGISVICVKCADLFDEYKKDQSKSIPKVKYIHNEEEGYFKAYEVTQFQKMAPEIIEKIKIEVESNPLSGYRMRTLEEMQNDD